MRSEGGSQPAEAEVLFPRDAAPKSIHRIFFWCVILGLGALQVWARRNEMQPDGISYIEIAWATARGGLHQIVNGYWSPLYPFLLSLTFRVLHPSPQWDFTTAHLLNLAIYAATFLSFEIFFKELILQRQTDSESQEKPSHVSPGTLWIWGYIFLLWAGYFWQSPVWVTPDLCVAALVFLATGLLLRIRRGQGNLLLFAALGGLLGIGYMAKAAMFPLSFVFLLSAFCLALRTGLSFFAASLRTLAAAVLFACIAVPLVVSLSAQKGRLTFGDSASMNYAMYVDGAPLWVHWHGRPADTGVPTHPMRQLSSSPPLYEFARPIPGSYPLWYDPSYWYEGIEPHFAARGQAWALYRATNVYLKFFSRTGVLYVVFFVLILMARKSGSWKFETRKLFFVWLPAFAAFGMYAFVHAEERFLGGFGLMLLMWFLSSLRLLPKADPQLSQRVIAVVGIAPLLAVTWAVTRDVKAIIQNKQYEPLVVAQQLHSSGISPGAEVGYLGTGADAYWAHLAGVRIVAEVPYGELPQFIAADASKRRKILALFASVGVKAVITKSAEAADRAEGWKEILDTGHYIWLVQEPSAASEKQ